MLRQRHKWLKLILSDRSIISRVKERTAFERDVSALKKAGIVGPKIKIRDANPSTTTNGKSIRELLKTFRTATPSGGQTAKIVKTNETAASEYKRLGYITDSRRGHKAERVLVPAPVSARVSADKQGQIHVHEVNGIETVHLPVQYHNLTQYIEDVMNDAKAINAMKERNEAFGFQFFGHNSKRAFGTIQQLFRYLMGYESVEQVLNRSHSKDAKEMIQNLIIVKSPEPDMYEFTGKKNRDELRRSMRVNKTPGKSGKWDNAARRAEWPKWKQDAYRAKHRMEEEKRRNKKRRKKGKK